MMLFHSYEIPYFYKYPLLLPEAISICFTFSRELSEVMGMFYLCIVQHSSCQPDHLPRPIICKPCQQHLAHTGHVALDSHFTEPQIHHLYSGLITHAS